METLKLTTKIDPDGHLRLDVSTTLPAGEVELGIVLSEAPAKSRYAYSDLVGKLTWRGDAVAAQRALRGERWTLLAGHQRRNLGNLASGRKPSPHLTARGGRMGKHHQATLVTTDGYFNDIPDLGIVGL